jgi:hypothetical protein
LQCYKGREQIKDEREGNNLAEKHRERRREKMHTTQDTTRETKQDKAKKEEPSKFKEGKEIKSYLNTVAGYITGDGANVKLKVSFLSAA